jgi:ubiquinone/menaquinone biosynthesis C-methylase UbiE
MLLWFALPVALVIVAALSCPRFRTPRRFGLEREADQEAAYDYDRLGNWFFFKSERYLALKELQRLRPEGSLVDIGCGPGCLTLEICRRFPELNVIALDKNRDMLALAKCRLSGQDIRLVEASVQSMPFNDSSLDLVVSTGSLHHWPEADRALREIYRVLKPGGQLLIMDLRRDIRCYMYPLALLFNLIVPPAIKRTNGAIGSLYASYTPQEARALSGTTSFRQWRVKPGLAWFFIQARK